MNIYFGLEAGGTKCVCLAAAGPEQILAERTIPTTTPGETLGAAAAFFAGLGLAPAACGVASFGPAVTDPASPNFGRIARTPKPGWEGADMLDVFAAYAVPKGFDTDVNGAALAEWRWGAGQSQAHLAYVTVGTGIGVGVLHEGRIAGGAWHLEMGHLRPRRAAGDDFPGLCPFHGDCFEGLASGPALLARFGAELSALPGEHPAHALVAEYLGQLCAALAFSHAPGRIVLGGGVMQTPGLLARVRARSEALLGGYAQFPEASDMKTWLIAPGLGPRAGVLGATALAMQAAEPAVPSG